MNPAAEELTNHFRTAFLVVKLRPRFSERFRLRPEQKLTGCTAFGKRRKRAVRNYCIVVEPRQCGREATFMMLARETPRRLSSAVSRYARHVFIPPCFSRFHQPTSTLPNGIAPLLKQSRIFMNAQKLSLDISGIEDAGETFDYSADMKKDISGTACWHSTRDH
jgi:hypothetical protein